MAVSTLKNRSKKRDRLKINKARVKERAAERGSGGGWLKIPDGMEFFQHVKGKNKIDILPYEVTVDTHPDAAKGYAWYNRTVFVHYDVGPDEKSYICPLLTIRKPCPICEHRVQLLRDQEEDEELTKQLKPRERDLFNVYVDNEVKLWTLSAHLFKRKLAEELHDDEEDTKGLFADPDEGSTLDVRFAQKSLGSNNFLEATRIDFLPRGPISDEVLDQVLDLDTILRILPYKQLSEIYYGLGVSEDVVEEAEEGEEEKTPPPKPKTTPKPKAATKPKPRPVPKVEPEPEPEEETEEETELSCPEGLVFGSDFNKYDVCDECDIREACESATGGVEEEGAEEEGAEEEGAEEEGAEEEGAEEDSCEKCPHGYVLGKNFNISGECDECVCWEACSDLNEKQLSSAKKPKPAAKPNVKVRPKKR